MDPNVQPVTDFPAEDSPYVAMPTTFAQPRDPKARPNVYPRPNCDPEKTAIIPAATSQAYPLDATHFFRGHDVAQERRMRDRKNAAAPPPSAPPPPPSASASQQPSYSYEPQPYLSANASTKPSRQRPAPHTSSRGSTVPRHLATSGAWSPAARQPRPQKPSSSTRNSSHPSSSSSY